MIGYRVNLHDDSHRKDLLEKNLRLVRLRNPQCQDTKEKRKQNAKEFYRESLRKSGEKITSFNELMRIQRIREKIQEW